MKILVINGVNLNMLGIREPGIYGNRTLDDINAYIKDHCDKIYVDVDFFQSNIEGEIVNMIHKAHFDYDGVVLNAGAFTHYSYAIHDAISSISKPVIEVHISNISARDEFRSKSVISEVCKGCIFGLGIHGYTLAIDYLNSTYECK